MEWHIHRDVFDKLGLRIRDSYFILLFHSHLVKKKKGSDCLQDTSLEFKLATRLVEHHGTFSSKPVKILPSGSNWDQKQNELDCHTLCGQKHTHQMYLTSIRINYICLITFHQKKKPSVSKCWKPFCTNTEEAKRVTLLTPLASGWCKCLVVKGQCDCFVSHEQRPELWEPLPYNPRWGREGRDTTLRSRLGCIPWNTNI